MKKVSLLAFLLATATAGVTAASAETLVPGCPKAFQGFGLKGNIGYGIGRGKFKSAHRASVFTVDGAQIADTSDYGAHRTDLGFAGVDGGIGVDYTHRFCNWALGIAFDANWANSKAKHRHARVILEEGSLVGNAASSKVHLRNSLQLYARAGYVIGGQVMPFVGLGWDNSQWKTNSRFAGQGPLAAPLAGRFHKSKRINSLLWKLGVDFLATKHCILGFEYTGTGGGRIKRHTTFNVAQTELANGNATPAATYQTKSSFRPQYNKFALTLKFIY
ncbi:MAG TPA: outer membrane beta-barrel protein [Alphaproteobacteria bacterium]|nr:outer membrane beta-barrel protein [Alphaproteobacteria bacterium]